MKSLLAGLALGALACNSNVTIHENVPPPPTTPSEVWRLRPGLVPGIEKVDLLFVVDNSRSMADKQEALRLALPDLVLQLVSPPCVDEAGTIVSQPQSALEACPPGARRVHEPILDIHIGMITSSIGGHGADSCEGDFDPSENDRSWLVYRDLNGTPLTGWNGKSFLVWDPNASEPTHSPPGETNATVLIDQLGTMIAGARERGCGYEAPLEAWYRFLVDPNPYQDITVDESGHAQLSGTDAQVLQHRYDFLRPDSLVLILLLSDENDCSIRDGGNGHVAAQRYWPGSNDPFFLPRPRAACASDPNSPCCRSCSEPPGCLQPDPNDVGNCLERCDESADECDTFLDPIEDHANLRCFDQKRRFGVDYLYPIDRYVIGLSSPLVPNRVAELVPNPLFTDLNTSDDVVAVRDPSLVLMAGLVGVPWQDVARRNASGAPDLISGLDESGNPIGAFQDAAELIDNGIWDLILGNPSLYVAPQDPLMIESVDPRSGNNPVTMEPLAPPGNPTGNSINGSEYSIPERDDLQYACIYPLATPRDCNIAPACDCPADISDPLCDPQLPYVQRYAKAYPGIRQLNVLKDIGIQGIVGSICPQQLDNPAIANFGYRPAMRAIHEQVKASVLPQCLDPAFEITPNADGTLPCRVIEARKAGTTCADVCVAPTRHVLASDDPAVLEVKKDPLATTLGWDCFCEIAQATGDALTSCQQDVVEPAVNGWCMVGMGFGNPALYEGCPSQPKRILRFVGEAHVAAGAIPYLACGG